MPDAAHRAPTLLPVEVIRDTLKAWENYDGYHLAVQIIEDLEKAGWFLDAGEPLDAHTDGPALTVCMSCGEAVRVADHATRCADCAAHIDGAGEAMA
jgi:hypothetical protein